ncbi:MAG: hypothetical protein IRY99_19210 [Isosphaeraceae bacterium]|nr:hypothetical protein [Isosphaeraceae bacterium]
MSEPPPRRRPRLTIRSIMLAIALLALITAGVVQTRKVALLEARLQRQQAELWTLKLFVLERLEMKGPRPNASLGHPAARLRDDLGYPRPDATPQQVSP